MKTILFADDNVAILTMYRKFIEKAGFNMIGVEDGEQALLHYDKAKPDAVVLDIMMPKKDGFTVLRELRQRPGGREVPVFMLTAKDLDEGILTQVEQLEPTYYLVKGNTTANDLVSKLQEVLAD